MNLNPIHPALLAALSFTACAPSKLPPAEGFHRPAVLSLEQASSPKATAEQRAALYLDAAREASTLLDSPNSGEPARVVYNKAASDLTVLLRSAGLWNRPLTLGSHRLRFAKGTRDGVWDPDYFTAFTPAATLDLKTIEHRNRVDGIGGALVGVRKTSPLEPFSPLVGVTAPVTAVLDFKGGDVTLSLIDPTAKTKARIAGRERALDADFSAPLAYYPQKSEFVEGLMGALRVQNHMGITGLYMLEPYDPDRIPLIFVHGLISTPRMWRNVINELEKDPVLRERYQCWVFAYPTGNPPLYSAMRLREELAKVQQRYPDSKDMVLIGHSMGGILSRTQVTSVERHHWDAIGKEKADAFFANVKPGSLVERATLFNANPHVDRAIFICTPHRGSEMAIGTLGELAIRLISLPVDIASTMTDSLGSSIAIITGDTDRVPNSVTGLSPGNPTFKVLDTRPIEVPHHSIIGDRGKGDTPDSSDGVVEYWSSHLKSAKSEKIVPGPHGACELPETLDELRRLLRLHLDQS
ncbi:MAG: alpha/beta hydrolase [Akkermansiaceae bacterium]|jgi:pimeloyl-ACP methyl ester carboxylesterase|nr:alpha/beta hydrolase [Akkermansiaceae bacterium]